LPLHIHENSEQSLESVINDCDIDSDFNTKQRLSAIVLEANKVPVTEVDDRHTVQVLGTRHM